METKSLKSVKVRRIVEELIQELDMRFGNRVKSVILFGSYARGEGEEESDVDVLVIGNVSLDEVLQVTYPIFLKHGTYISPLVIDGDHFEMLKAEKSGFIENVLKEGVVLYGRV